MPMNGGSRNQYASQNLHSLAHASGYLKVRTPGLTPLGSPGLFRFGVVLQVAGIRAGGTILDGNWYRTESHCTETHHAETPHAEPHCTETPRAETPRAETLRKLRQICRGTAKPFIPLSDQPLRLSTGLSALDALLPGGGLEPGWIVEWLSPVEGCGAAVLALQGVRPALQRRPVWAVVDGTGEFHPSAAWGWGVSLDTLLWLRPSSVADTAWTIEQCLRCPAVGVTWFQADLLPDRVLQRWKIAAGTGGGIGILFRPARAARNASWADVRWLVQPRPAAVAQGRRVRVELLSCRGECRAGDSIELDVCDAAGHVRLVSSVAGAAPAIRAAGA